MDFITRDVVSYCLAAPSICAALGDMRRVRGVALLVCVLGVGLLTSPLVSALLLGGVTVFGVSGAPPWWRVISLIIFALLPGQVWGCAAVLPVVFWPWLAEEKATTRAALSRGGSVPPGMAGLAALLVWHSAASAPLCTVVLCCLMAVVLAMRTVQGVVTDVAAAGMVRPALLVALSAAAQHEGLDQTGQGAIMAAVLDLVVQWLRSWPVKYIGVASVLAAPFPPMPGFIVLWVGVHAALNLAAAASGWAVPAMLCALVLGVLAVLELWHVCRMPRQGDALSLREVRKAGGLLGALTVILVVIQKYGLGGNGLPFASLGGGDGAFLHIGFIALFLSLFYWILVRRGGGSVFFGRGLVFPRGPIFPVRRGAVPWSWRRYLVVVRKVMRDVAFFGGRGGARLSAVGPALREGGASLGWWLVVLTIILAVLGAQA
ncbi:hypothetical protein [Neokomagataea thailandica]|uniref:hypothetical protein n=1 Tax=Neokomagataea TaxID=1223423 RepID=UPI00082C1E68|nr:MULTISPECIES: hypothetical protein [Neokomagataea]